MYVKTLALAVLSLTGGAVAQCGQAQLTTPPGFVSNNGGSVGGMVYFTLDVLAPTGVDICGIAVNTSMAGDLDALVYLHQSLTDWSLLAAGNNTPGDWCTIGRLHGVGAGLDVPSTCVIDNATNSIALPAGQYLLAIGGGNFNHAYTNGTGANQVVADANLGFSGGMAANAPSAALLFSPRIVNCTIDYNVGAAALSVCTIASAGGEVGLGCGGGPATISELFDAVNVWDLTDGLATPPTTNDLVFAGGLGTTSSVVVPGGSPIVPVVAPDLGLGDDEVAPQFDVGFDFGFIGLPCATTIAVDSNGVIWIGNSGASDYSPSLTELANGAARLCPQWDDLRPGVGMGSGTIHLDHVHGVETIVTYLQVERWGMVGTDLTFQISLTPSTIVCRYDALSPFSAALVGYHNGTPTSLTQNSDLTAGAISVAAGGVDLALRLRSLSTIGGALDMDLLNCPDGGIGAVLCTVGFTGPPVPLPPPVAANCSGYIPFQSPVLGLVVGASACASYPFQIVVPNTAAWVGLPLAAQAAAFDGISSFYTSNAIDSVTGSF